MPPPPPIQQTVTVDWTDPTADYSTITEALTDPSLTLAMGDTILVRGFESGGYPAAYCEHDPNGVLMETFPLSIPEGVSLVADTNTPRVYIWSDGTLGTPSALIEHSSADEVGSAEALFKGLTLGGGAIGLQIEPPFTADDDLEVRLDDIIFVGNEVGLSAISTRGGQLVIDVEHCKFHNIAFNPGVLAVPPVLLSPAIGLRFHAIDVNGAEIDPPHVDAKVLDLKVVGLPQVMGTQYWLDLTDFVLENGANSLVESSRLIEVYAHGDGTTREHRPPENSPPPPYIPPFQELPIAQVELDILGSSLDGRAVESGKGWDLGLYCAVTPTSYSINEVFTALDFAFTSRPGSASGLRDKGAHEVQP